MKYVIEFWNPWEGRRQRWNMEPVGGTEVCDLLFEREQIDGSLNRRIVEVKP